jgi:transcriptional regulator with XRE-family HTH domain
MTIGERIAALRKKANLTQDALAKHLGISPQAVSKWEHNQSCPDILLLPELAKILGVTTDELLGGLPTEPVENPAEEIPEADPPEAEQLGFRVEPVNGNHFDVHIDPPRGAGITMALWVLLTGGLMLAGQLLNRPDMGFWTALMIGGLLVFSLRSMRKRIGFLNTVSFLGGGFLALSNLGLIQLELNRELVLPLLLVLLGVFLLFKQFRKGKRGRGGIHITGPNGPYSPEVRVEDGYLCYHNAFGEDHFRVVTPKLEGGEVNVSFGEHTLDFSGVESLGEHCALELNSAFGEINLEIPRRYQADIRLSKSFAEYEVNGHPDPEPEGVITINANLSFGELSLRYI